VLTISRGIPAANSRERPLVNPAQIKFKGLLFETPHGRIEEVSLHGSRFVLKKTRSDLVDTKALQKLENQQIAASFGNSSVTIATPLKIWEEENHICELLPYYEGINLHDLVERNKYKFCGGYLGIIYDCGFRALSKPPS
jgi:hypothetical protein